MIFWISLAVLIIGIGLIILSYKIDSCDVGYIGTITIIIGILATLVLGTTTIIVNCNSQGTLIELQERYTAINTKITTEIYTDKFDINDKDIITEIYEYNKEVKYGKHYQKDFWIGIFVPNIYDELETIDYNVVEN
jgi:hypothetical protein